MTVDRSITEYYVLNVRFVPRISKHSDAAAHNCNQFQKGSFGEVKAWTQITFFFREADGMKHYPND
jgi:hypothetical protein